MNPMGYAPMIPSNNALQSGPNPLRQQIAQAMMGGGAPQMGGPPQGMRPQMGVIPMRGMAR